MPNVRRTSFGVGLRLQRHGQDHHVDVDLADRAQQGVVHLHHQSALGGRALAGHRRDVGHLAADELHPFVLHAVVELLESLARRADVDVAVVDLGLGLLADQVGELQGVHAADARAVGVVVGVAAADAMDDAHALGRRAVAQHELSGGRPAGVQQPLDLQAGVDVRILAVAVVRDDRGIERLEAGGHDDRPDLVLLDPFLLVEAEGIPLAAGLDAALLALAAGDLEADLGIDHGHRRHGLGEGNPHRLALAEALIEGVGELGLGEHAAVDALHAADAEALVDVSRLAADLHLEVAHRALDRFDAWNR